MIVDLTPNMLLAIEVAFAELQTGEWLQFVTEEQSEQVEDGQSELEGLIREHKKR